MSIWTTPPFYTNADTDTHTNTYFQPSGYLRRHNFMVLKWQHNDDTQMLRQTTVQQSFMYQLVKHAKNKNYGSVWNEKKNLEKLHYF